MSCLYFQIFCKKKRFYSYFDVTLRQSSLGRIKTDTDRHRQTYRQKVLQHTDRQIERHARIYTHAHKQRHTHRQTDRRTDRNTHTDRQIERHAHVYTHSHTKTHTHTDRHTDRQRLETICYYCSNLYCYTTCVSFGNAMFFVSPIKLI